MADNNKSFFKTGLKGAIFLGILLAVGAAGTAGVALIAPHLAFTIPAFILASVVEGQVYQRNIFGAFDDLWSKKQSLIVKQARLNAFLMEVVNDPELSAQLNDNGFFHDYALLQHRRLQHLHGKITLSDEELTEQEEQLAIMLQAFEACLQTRALIAKKTALEKEIATLRDENKTSDFDISNSKKNNKQINKLEKKNLLLSAEIAALPSPYDVKSPLEADIYAFLDRVESNKSNTLTRWQADLKGAFRGLTVVFGITAMALISQFFVATFMGQSALTYFGLSAGLALNIATPIAGFAAIGYALLMYASMRDMLENDTVRGTLRRIANAWTPEKLKKLENQKWYHFPKLKHRSLLFLKLAPLAFIFVMATLVTAGTWWFAARSGANFLLGKIQGLIGTVIASSTAPFAGMAEVSFNLDSTIKAADDLPKLKRLSLREQLTTHFALREFSDNDVKKLLKVILNNWESIYPTHPVLCHKIHLIVKGGLDHRRVTFSTSETTFLKRLLLTNTAVCDKATTKHPLNGKIAFTNLTARLAKQFREEGFFRFVNPFRFVHDLVRKIAIPSLLLGHFTSVGYSTDHRLGKLPEAVTGVFSGLQEFATDVGAGDILPVPAEPEINETDLEKLQRSLNDLSDGSDKSIFLQTPLITTAESANSSSLTITPQPAQSSTIDSPSSATAPHGSNVIDELRALAKQDEPEQDEFHFIPWFVGTVLSPLALLAFIWDVASKGPSGWSPESFDDSFKTYFPTLRKVVGKCADSLERNINNAARRLKKFFKPTSSDSSTANNSISSGTTDSLCAEHTESTYTMHHDSASYACQQTINTLRQEEKKKPHRKKEPSTKQVTPTPETVTHVATTPSTAMTIVGCLKQETPAITNTDARSTASSSSPIGQLRSALCHAASSHHALTSTPSVPSKNGAADGSEKNSLSSSEKIKKPTKPLTRTIGISKLTAQFWEDIRNKEPHQLDKVSAGNKQTSSSCFTSRFLGGTSSRDKPIRDKKQTRKDDALVARLTAQSEAKRHSLRLLSKSR